MAQSPLEHFYLYLAGFFGSVATLMWFLTRDRPLVRKTLVYISAPIWGFWIILVIVAVYLAYARP